MLRLFQALQQSVQDIQHHLVFLEQTQGDVEASEEANLLVFRPC